MSLDELLHYLRLGGVTLAALLGASLLALGVAVERLIALWNVGGAARTLASAVDQHLLRGDVAAARTAAERSESLAADLFLAGFNRAARPGATGESVATAVERERTQLGLQLRRNLWILGTVGATAPFVGLFGTVAGIMTSFKQLGLDVQAGGTGGPGVVMAGISEALIVTAVGILVAVQAVVLYNYFQSKLARLSVELRLLSEEFVELLREKALAPERAGSPTALPSPGAPAAEGA